MMLVGEVMAVTVTARVVGEGEGRCEEESMERYEKLSWKYLMPGDTQSWKVSFVDRSRRWETGGRT